MKTARLLAAFACVLVCGLSAPAPAQTAPDADIIGLWAYETSFPVGLSGELTLVRDGARWRASIGGTNAAAAAARGGDLRLAFPNSGGAVRARVDTQGRIASAFWVRRAMTDDPRYPQGSTQAYATPLTLHAAGRNQWRATVRPLADPFTLYLSIFRDSAGALKAAFRNPEQHSHGPGMLLDVVRTGDRLRFTGRAFPGAPEGQVEARVLGGPDRIEVQWDDLGGRTIALTRYAPERAARFSPRPPGSPAYVYRQPETTDDGWRTARAAELGVDEAALARAVQRIIDIDPASQRAWLIHSMAVAYRGRLILDEYFYGFGRDEPHDTRSAGKALSSVVLGALMHEGRDIGPNTPLYQVMAPLGPFANPDPRKARVTVGHALTHSTGLACDDNAEEPVSPGNEDVMQAQTREPNWWKFTLDLPMQYEPGTHYAYCSGSINIAGGALSMASGEWLPALFDRTIARPLQWGEYHWNIMPNGEGYLGGGAFVRTRDFLKLGQMMLDGGVWNGRRVMTEAWARDAVGPHMRISPETTGVSGDAFAMNYYETDEGYGWHIINVRSGDRNYPAFHTNGNGGQLLLVLPQFDLAVMFTAGNYRQGLWNRERDDIVGDMIIPALGRHE